VSVEADVGNEQAGMLKVPCYHSTDSVIVPIQQIGGGKIATVGENATGRIIGRDSGWHYKQVPLRQAQDRPE
jgi:hypothetical protein